MSFTTRLIIFLIGVAILAGIASVIIEFAKYISIAAILMILVVLVCKLFVFLFVGKSD